jgi:hypothetical protein
MKLAVARGDIKMLWWSRQGNTRRPPGRKTRARSASARRIGRVGQRVKHQHRVERRLGKRQLRHVG